MALDPGLATDATQAAPAATGPEGQASVFAVGSRAMPESLGSQDTIAADRGDAPTQASFPTGTAPGGSALPRGAMLGRYMVLHVLGRGGMGVVYAAFDPQLDRKVALKLMHASSAATSAVLLREGRAIAKLAHPNVVTVHDVGEHGGDLFVAMELVEGRSLDHWLAAEPRSWREVVNVFRQAGAGLVAAHAIGMIHRDFKPANVLMGADGRPRVTDFGLARLTANTERSALATEAAAEAISLTQTGAIVGTPAYMPPEQFHGENVDAKSDQFSFAVALHEALYGARPFAGTTIGALLASIEDNAVAPPPAGSRVPPWLRAIVLRGLRADPSERYPSLSAMLDELARDPSSQRKKLALAGGLAATLGLAATAIATSRADGPSCTISEHALDGVWDASVRSEVAARFGASTKPYARSELTAVQARLDEYAEGWRTMQQDACEAAHVRGEQTEAQQGMRTLCLEQRKVELRAVTALFAHADDDVIANARTTLASLQPLETCADLRLLSARVAPPSDPALRIRVDALRSQLANTRALGSAGKYEVAAKAASQLSTEATATGYRPIEGEARLLEGTLLARAGDAKLAARTLTLAIQASEAARDDAAAAVGWRELASTHASLARHDDALSDLDHASAMVERLGGDPTLSLDVDAARVKVLSSRGQLLDAFSLAETVLARRRRQLPPDPAQLAHALESMGNRLSELGRYRDAVAMHREALALRRTLLGDDHPEVASALHGLGAAQIEASDFGGAEASLRQALAIRERTLPANHPDTARVLLTLAGSLRAQARYEEALLLDNRALALTIEHSGPLHPDTARAYHQLGGLYLLMQRFPEAMAALEESRRIWEASTPDHPDFAVILGTLAQTERRLGKEAAALEHALKALAVIERALGPDHPNAAIAHDHLAELYLTASSPDPVRALGELERSLAINERALGPEHQTLAITLANMCDALDRLGRHAEATSACARALLIDEKTLGPDHPELSYDLIGLAGQEIATGHPERAIPLYERTLQLREIDKNPRQYVSATFRLAMALWDSGGDRARARTLMQKAHDLAPTPEIAAFTATWLAKHK